MTLRVLVSRIQALFGRRRRDAALNDEIQAHLDSLADDYIRRGMLVAAARAAARRDFGGVDQVVETYRDQRGLPFVDALQQDLRFAMRTFLKAPALTLVVIVTLALAIGANTAIFSVVDTFLLKPLPIGDPRQVVQVNRTGPGGQGPVISYPTYQFLRDHTSAFAEMAATGRVWHWSVTLASDAGPERVAGELVTGNYFSLLETRAWLGRTLTPEDNLGSSAGGRHGAVAIVSYDYWRRRFDGDRAIVGRTFQVSGAAVTIVGVAAPSFTGVELADPVDVWMPLILQPTVLLGQNWLDQPGSNWLRAIGRLKPGISRDAAREETDRIFSRLPNAGGQRIVLADAAYGLSTLHTRLSFSLGLLMAAVVLVLLVAGANVAGLLLAKANGRRKEFALRLALGASRGRLIRQLLTESVCLSGLGGAIGLLFASWISRALVTVLLQRSGSAPLTPELDWRIMVFTSAVSVLTGIVFGLAPALGALRMDQTGPIKPGFHPETPRVRTLGSILVTAQVAVSLLLIVVAGVFMRTLVNLQNLDTGFEQARVLVISLDPVATGHSGPEFAELYHELLTRINALPGVHSASLSDVAWFGNGPRQRSISVREYVPKPEDDLNPFTVNVSPTFFETMGIPLLAGRGFAAADEARASQVAIVNETFARYYFGTQSPIGRRFGFGGPGSSGEVEIVGLARDVKFNDLRERPVSLVFTPIAFNQFPNTSFSFSSTTLAVRAAGDPTVLAALVRREIHAIDRTLPIVSVNTMKQQVDRSLGEERLTALLSSAFAAVTMLLACIGLYGVMAYSVSRRTREIGVRLALGATGARIARMVARESLSLVMLGVAIGLPPALALTQVLRSRLFGVTAADPLTASIALGLMIATGAIAAWLPARRAAGVDPMAALRHE